MKKFLVLLPFAIVSLVACVKDSHGTDNTTTAATQQANKVEDNPNGGGGNNTTSIPAAVQTAFQSRYPDATMIQWKKLSDGTYKAEFFRGAVKWQAIFSPAGSLLKQEHD